MKVLKYYGPKQVRIEEISIPKIYPKEVLIRVKTCGICATDAKTYKIGHPKIKPPAVLGHEVSGIIEDLLEVKGLKKGDRVVVAPYVPCGNCFFCKKGEFTLCENIFHNSLEPGGFSQFIRVPENIVEKGLYKIPDNLSFEEASLVEPIACCIHGLEDIKLKTKESLLIIGDGFIGIIQAEIARHIGAKPIIISGLTPHRLLRGKRVADYTINIKETDLHEEIFRITKGIGVDKVMISVADKNMLKKSFYLVRKGGFINIFAGLPQNLKLDVDPYKIHYGQVKLVGSFGFSHIHFKKALKLLSEKKIDLTGIITNLIPFYNIEKGLEDVLSYKGIKTVVVF